MKLNRIQKILLWLDRHFGVAVADLLNVVSVTTPLSENQPAGASNTFSMLKYSLIDYPVNAVTDFFTSFSRLWQVCSETTCFAPKSIKLFLPQAQLAEPQRQIEELKQIAELKTIVSGLRADSFQLYSRTRKRGTT